MIHRNNRLLLHHCPTNNNSGGGGRGHVSFLICGCNEPRSESHSGYAKCANGKPNIGNLCSAPRRCRYCFCFPSWPRVVVVDRSTQVQHSPRRAKL
jgi:hypothetical protein